MYGAWPNNPVPLTEDAPLRPNPHFSPAVQGAEVERLLAEWRDEHPDVTVTTLRSAPVVGPGRRTPSRRGSCSGVRRCACAARRCRCRSCTSTTSRPALALAATRDLPGVYNVAADGWLDADAARALLPRASVPAVPAEVLERALAAHLGSSGSATSRPASCRTSSHPWVIANDKLKADGLGAEPHQRGRDPRGARSRCRRAARGPA